MVICELEIGLGDRPHPSTFLFWNQWIHLYVDIFSAWKFYGDSFIVFNHCIKNPDTFMKWDEWHWGKGTKILANCTDHLPKIEGAQKLLILAQRVGTSF